MFSLSIVTPPVGMAVTTAEMKEHLRILHNEDDGYIEGLLRVATEEVEAFTSRALITRTLKVLYGCFNEQLILPVAPVSSITHLKYYDTNGTQQTVAGADYQYDLNALPVEIIKGKDLGTWPTTESEKLQPIEIQFVAGYASASVVPENFKLAMKMIAADLYWNRGNIVVDVSKATQRAAELLVYQYRLWT